jgi:hypothetical protein
MVLLLLFVKDATVAAAPLGIGGRTGVVTERDAVNFSKEVLFRNEFDGLLGESGESELPFVTTATIGRRGRLYSTVRLRDGCAPSISACSVLRVLDLVGDSSSSLCLVLFAAGEGDRDADPHGFRAKLTIRPDMERDFNGRATGSGALVSGIFVAVTFWASKSFRSSDDESVKWATAAGDFSGFFFERRDVRRRISLPAATLSFVGDSDRVGTA